MLKGIRFISLTYKSDYGIMTMSYQFGLIDKVWYVKSFGAYLLDIK